MSEIKFSCPSCQQHIQCDTSYSGLQIDCPACRARMIVPGDPPASMPAPADHACPNCNSPLSHGAVICTHCGFNLRTGQTMPAPPPPRAAVTGRRKKRKRKRAATAREEKWYASPWPYVGMLVLVFALLYYASKSSKVAYFVFLGLAGLYIFGVHISVAVHAFRNEGIGWAFACFCIPFVDLYYVYKRSDSDFLKAFYTLLIVLNVTIQFANLEPPEGSQNDIEHPFDEGAPTNQEAASESI